LGVEHVGFAVDFKAGHLLFALFYQTALQKKFLRIQRKLMSLGMLLYTELVRRGKFAFFVSGVA